MRLGQDFQVFRALKKMKLTEEEQEIARLALDKGAKDGERQAAAAKLVESLYARGVSVEDIEKTSVRVEYRDRHLCLSEEQEKQGRNSSVENSACLRHVCWGYGTPSWCIALNFI
jgi:hypothetical protein